MHYKLGDTLILTIDAFNPQTKEIVWKKGTEVIISFIKGDTVTLKFPDGSEHPHKQQDVLMVYENKSAGKLLTHKIAGSGTPPKALQKYLPEGTNWRKNYVWSFHIALEEREDKKIICPDCTNDLGKNKINEIGKTDCDNCGLNVVPYDLSSREEKN